MENMFILWIIVSAIFLIIEVGHPGLFFFIPFALGAFATGLVSLWFTSLAVQGFFFLAISAGAFFVLHSLLNVRHRMATGTQHTNVDALVGQHGIVVKSITPLNPGYVRVHSEEWLARSTHDTNLDTGTIIEIVAVRGAHVLVRSKPELPQ